MKLHRLWMVSSATVATTEVAASRAASAPGPNSIAIQSGGVRGSARRCVRCCRIALIWFVGTAIIAVWGLCSTLADDAAQDATPATSVSDAPPLGSALAEGVAAAEQRPTLDELMARFAEIERSYLPFAVRSLETFRMESPVTDPKHPPYPWADGRTHQRAMEYTFKAPREWVRREGQVVDRVLLRTYQWVSTLDGVHHQSSAGGLPKPFEPHGEFPMDYVHATPYLGIFLPAMYNANAPRLSELYKSNPGALQLSWDGPQARLQVLVSNAFRQRFVVWLDPQFQWHPVKMQRFMQADDADWFEEWTATKFSQPTLGPRVESGTVRYRQTPESQPGDDAPQPAVPYAVDFELEGSVFGESVSPAAFHPQTLSATIVRMQSGNVGSRIDADGPPPAGAALGVTDSRPEVASPVQPQPSAVAALTLEVPAHVRDQAPLIAVTKALEDKHEVAYSDGSDRVGKPVDYYAEIHARYELDYRTVVSLIEQLQELGVDRFTFAPPNADRENKVIVACPANVSWRRVRELTEALEAQKAFQFDVRIAASDAPVTPVRTSSPRTLPTDQMRIYVPLPVRERTPIAELMKSLESKKMATFTAEPDPGDQPAAESAEIQVQPDFDLKRLHAVLLRVQMFGINHFSLLPPDPNLPNRIVITCPKEVTENRVRELTEPEWGLPSFEVAVQIAGSDAPPMEVRSTFPTPGAGTVSSFGGSPFGGGPATAPAPRSEQTPYRVPMPVGKAADIVGAVQASLKRDQEPSDDLGINVITNELLVTGDEARLQDVLDRAKKYLDEKFPGVPFNWPTARDIVITQSGGDSHAAEAAATPAEGPAAPSPAAGAETESRVSVFPIRFARAADVARIIEQLLVQPGRPLTLSVDERTNQILARVDEKLVKELEQLIDVLDVEEVPTPSPRSGSGASSNPQPAQPRASTFGGGRQFDSNSRPGGVGVDRSSIPHSDSGVEPPAGLAPSGPAAITIDILESLQPGAVGSGERSKVLFLIDSTTQTVGELRAESERLERRTRELGGRLRGPQADPAAAKRLNDELRTAVQQAFDARQNLQRAEVLEMAQRLLRLQQTIELRQRIADRIIARRIEELLDPSLEWDQPPTPADPTPTYNSGPLSSTREPTPNTTSGYPGPVPGPEPQPAGPGMPQSAGPGMPGVPPTPPSVGQLPGGLFRWSALGDETQSRLPLPPGEPAFIPVNRLPQFSQTAPPVDDENTKEWLAKLQGRWSATITQIDRQGETKVDTAEALIQGSRMTTTTLDDSNRQAMDMLFRLPGPPQQVDLKMVATPAEIAEIWSDPFIAHSYRTVVDGVPVFEALIEETPDGFRICADEAGTHGRPIKFIAGPASVLWEFRRLDGAAVAPAGDGTSVVPPLALAKSPDELHDRLNQRDNQVGQIEASIQRWTQRKAEGEDAERCDRSIQSLQQQLVEYRRHQALAVAEYNAQVALLTSELALANAKFEAAAEQTRLAERMVQKGYRSAAEVKAIELQEQAAQLEVQRVEAQLQIYRQAGEGLLGTTPVEEATGSILSREHALLEISLGVDDGVRVGEQMLIVNGSQPIGMLEVTSVQPDRAAARVLKEDRTTPVRKGDGVGRRVAAEVEVVKVDSDGVIEVAQGSDDVVEGGTRFAVFRGEEYLGLIDTFRMEAGRAFCRPTNPEAKLELQPGDRARRWLDAARTQQALWAVYGFRGEFEWPTAEEQAAPGYQPNRTNNELCPTGLRVKEVRPDSPAAAAGVEVGDLLYGLEEPWLNVAAPPENRVYRHWLPHEWGDWLFWRKDALRTGENITLWIDVQGKEKFATLEINVPSRWFYLNEPVPEAAAELPR